MALKEINDDTIARREAKRRRNKRTDCWLSARIARIVNFQFIIKISYLVAGCLADIFPLCQPISLMLC